MGYKKKFLIQGMILIGGAVGGLVLLILVHLLPLAPMKEHVYWSMDMIEREFEQEEVILGHPATLTGNFTDCLMLEHAVYSYEEHGVLAQVLHMFRGESYYEEGNEEGWQPGESLRDYLGGAPQPREVEYGRYWHGYLVILKPLLLLTSVNTLRLINSAFQLFCVGGILILLTKKNAEKLAVAFLFSLPFLYYVSSFASLSLSICLCLMLCEILFQVCMDEKLYRRGRYAEFFLIMGMLTSYFDFLTYPLITLGYPLCVYCYFHMDDKVEKQIKKVLFYSVEWGIGYAGMWAEKWVLSDLLSDSHVIQDAWENVRTRTGSAAEYSRLEGFFHVVGRNVKMYGNWCYVLVAVGVIVFVVICVRKGKMLRRRMAAQIGSYALIALYPFFWYFLIENHSEQHWLFTCRILAISVFALGAGAAGFSRSSHGTKNEEN